jgi:hypothetical protein
MNARSRLRVLACAAALLAGPAGCSFFKSGLFASGSRDNTSGENPFKVAESQPASEGGVRTCTVRFNILRIEVPGGSLQRIDKIWSMVDTSVVPPDVAATMRDNGFLIGAGRDEARAPIRAAIDTLPDVRSREDQALPGVNKMLEIFITDAQRDMELIWFTRDGRMPGQSFESARPVLRLGWGIEPPRLNDVVVHVEPEIRELPGRTRYTRLDDLWVLRPEYRGRVFKELGFDVAIPEGGFLMLGPTNDIARYPTIGRPFFTEPAGGSQRESLYVISPLVRWGPAPAIMAPPVAPPPASPTGGESTATAPTSD